MIGGPSRCSARPKESTKSTRTWNASGGEITSQHFETTRVRKDGRRIDMSLSISPIKDANGTVIGASAIARDITERKVLQREVLEIAAREQRRIGQDLHDGTGQELTGLAMMAQRLVAELAAKSLPQAATAAKDCRRPGTGVESRPRLSKGLSPSRSMPRD